MDLRPPRSRRGQADLAARLAKMLKPTLRRESAVHITIARQNRTVLDATAALPSAEHHFTRIDV